MKAVFRNHTQQIPSQLPETLDCPDSTPGSQADGNWGSGTWDSKPWDSSREEAKHLQCLGLCILPS